MEKYKFICLKKERRRRKMMKLPRVFYGRNLLLMYLIVSILLSLTMVGVPIEAQAPDPVTFYVKMPNGWIPGVAPGDLVPVEVWIDSPPDAGIVAWTLSLQWDPTVLEIGYFVPFPPPGITLDVAEGSWLKNWTDTYPWPDGTTFLEGSIDKEGGKVTTTSCGINKWRDLPSGAGAGGTGQLVIYYFTSLSETAYSPLDLIDADCEYGTTEKVFSVDVVIDGHYNQPLVLTVESTPIDGINFTIDTTTYTTNCSVSLLKGDYTVAMPSTWMVGADEYNFKHWEDDSTDPVRTVSLTTNLTITATYVPVYNLTVESLPIGGIDFTVDATAYTTNATVELEEGSYTVAMPSAWMVGTDQYDFVEWENGSTNPVRVVSLTADTTITATYELAKEYTLTVNSDPITSINFTVDGVTYATNWSDVLIEGAYTVVMPSTWTTVGGDVYNFVHWEDASTSASRVVSLTADMTITATYEPELVDPTASFTFLPTAPIVAETVTFNASASNDPDGTIVSYAWDFGDGASGSGAIVEHTYAAAGNYDVTLTVTDNDGLAHTITKSIKVREAPPPSIPWQLYVAAVGAAAIIIAAVTIYFLRIRKPT